MNPLKTKRLRVRCALLAMLACALGAAFAAPAAQAEFGLADFGVELSSGGEFSRQAGAAADLQTKFDFNVASGPEGTLPDGTVRDVKVQLPPGEVGNPTNVPTCTRAELVGGFEGARAICPVGSQVGVALITFVQGEYGTEKIPVYNIAPPPDLPALFGMNFLGAEIMIEPDVRPGDYGIEALSARVSQANPIIGIDLTLWDVPADPIHNVDRKDAAGFGWGVPSTAPRLPFMRNPTSCDAAASAAVAADSWQQPGVFDRKQTSIGLGGIPLRMEGCRWLPFEPSVVAQPTEHAAGGPMGLQFELEVPQNEDPEGLSSADMRRAVVTLPQGVVVSPSAARGLGSCSPQQVGLESDAPAACPASSRIGSVEIETPLLRQPLQGDVVVAKQDDNPFHSLLALYLVVEGSGVRLKLPGRVDLDPATGQIVTTFDDTPQLPFSKLRLSLRGGPTAPLAAPNACGELTAHAEITSWASDEPVSLDTPMSFDEGCGREGRFEPDLRAGVGNPVAGSSSPFSLRVTREDAEENVSRIDATLPEGLLAKLAGVPLCAEAAAATGACDPGSRIGTVGVGVGAGSDPLQVPEAGKAPTAIYLAGPYKGAPYSLVFSVPAQTGPFDLGTVVTRGALAVDSVTTQASVRTDPLPQILQGIPLSYRSIEAAVDRDGFMRNPTSCEPMAVAATIVSAQGQSVDRSRRFKVADCAALAFKPKLGLKLSGGTKRNSFPALTATLKMPTRNQANIAKVAVTLPHSEFLEQAHIGTVCTRVQYAAQNCPKASVYGYAKAYSPLLEKPLQGPVYLRSSNHPLPDLVASLDGQIHVDLAGRIDSPHGNGIRTTFATVPDAPVSKFVLSMRGGGKGLLVNSRDLCAKPARATVAMVAQNGKSQSSRPLLASGCPRRR